MMAYPLRHNYLLIVMALASFGAGTLFVVPARAQTFSGAFQASGTISNVWSDQLGTHECDWSVLFTWQVTANLDAGSFHLSGTRTETVINMVNFTCSDRVFPYDYVVPISVSGSCGSQNIQGVLDSGGFHETIQGTVSGTILDGTWTQTFTMAGWTQSLIVGSLALQQASSSTCAPQLTVTPGSLDFGSVPLNETREQILILQNTGAQGSLLIGSVFSPSSPFIISQGVGTFSLGPGDTVIVAVDFQAVGKGSFTDVVTITSNDPLATSVTVPLSATGSAAGDLKTVTVWVDAFIPWSRFGPLLGLPDPPFFSVGVPLSFLSTSGIGGDGRSFTANPNASFRVQWRETVDVASLQPIVYSISVGPSHIEDMLTGAILLSQTTPPQSWPTSRKIRQYPPCVRRITL